MDEEKLIQDFFQVNNVRGNVQLLVRTISWDSPHEPLSRWVQVATMNKQCDKDEIRNQMITTMRDRRFFCDCSECGEKVAAGMMFDDDICQSCAESKHGVVF